MGHQALQGNTTGSGNVAIGDMANFTLATGSNNTCIGSGTTVSGSSPSNSTAIGNGAMASGSNKVRIGNDNVTNTDIAGQLSVNVQSNTNSYSLPTTRGTSGQVLTTDGAGAANWTTPSSGGWSLTGNTGTNPSTNFIGNTDDTELNFKINGTKAGYISYSAGGNTSLGYGAAANNYNTNSTAIGKNALNVAPASENTAVGYNAFQLGSIMQGTAVGTNAGRYMSGSQNVALGYSAMQGSSTASNNTGNYNVALGSQTLQSVTSGASNTALGYLAGAIITIGSQNTFLGSNSTANTPDRVNATAIGYNTTVDADNKVRIGNDQVTATDLAGQVRVNAGVAGGSNSYTLPATRGTANQVLTTNADGTTSWTTASGGGGTTLPSQTGNSGKVLTTDGTNLSWGNNNNEAQVALVATKTAGSQTLANANGTNLGDLVTFDNIVTANTTYGTYNTGTNTFTVAQAGVYFIQAATRSQDATPSSNTVNQFLQIDVNGAGMTGVNNIITEFQIANPTNFPAGVKGKGYTSVMQYLQVGDTVRILGLTANASTAGTPLKTDNSCKFMIFKM